MRKLLGILLVATITFAPLSAAHAEDLFRLFLEGQANGFYGDNIPLRTETTLEGKRRSVMEVTELQRTRQDPALFVLPANIQVMKLPKGIMPGSAAPGKQ